MQAESVRSNLRSIQGQRDISVDSDFNNFWLKYDTAKKQRDDGNSTAYNAIMISAGRFIAELHIENMNSVNEAKISSRSGKKVIHNSWDAFAEEKQERDFKPKQTRIDTTKKRGRGRPAGSFSQDSLTGKIRNLLQNGESGITQAKLAAKVGKQSADIAACINNGRAKANKNKWCYVEGRGLSRRVYSV